MLKKKTRLRNKFEKRIDRRLKKAKVRYGYERKKIPYILSCHYITDFDIITPSGQEFLIECKGYLRAEDKRKLRAVKRLYPTLDLRILFYKFVPSQIKWAEKNKIPYAISEIPEEWLQ